MSNSKKRKNIDGYKVLVYIRYILPIILCIATIFITLVPCLSYTTGTNAPGEPISLRELFGNSWDNVRAYLFSGQEQSPALHGFSVKLLVILIVFFILFAVGFISTVAVAVCALGFISKRDRRSRTWLWFITLVPNRIVACILQGLTLPLLFLPRAVVPMYRTMGETVTLTTTGIEPMVWGIIFMVISVALSVFSSFAEKELKLDAFDRPKELTEAEEQTDTEDKDYTPSFRRGRAYAKDETEQRSKKEQEELIKQLLGDDKDEKNK